MVAEFATPGSIALLRNVAESGEPPRFFWRKSIRPGAIHVPVHDFNDGRPDFLGLVSQEYETVDMFLNQGNGKFRLQNLWAGPDLTFGSSGIELVDLERRRHGCSLFQRGFLRQLLCQPNSWNPMAGEWQDGVHLPSQSTGVYRALPVVISMTTATTT
jgi:hypothetical protein